MTSIIFFVSLFVLVSLIIIKWVETRFNKTPFWSGLRAKGDIKLNYFTAFLIGKYKLYRKIANIFTFEYLPIQAYHLVVRFKNYLSSKYHIMEESFRGRRELKNTGSVSFFLDRIGTEKTKTDNFQV